MALDEQQRFILAQLRKGIQQRFGSIQEAFLKVDTDRSGSISVDEFAAVLRIHNVRCDSQDVERLAEAFDANKDGRVSYDEFCRTVESGPYVAATPAVATSAAATAANPPVTAPLRARLKSAADGDYAPEELLAYFRRAVEQCFPSLHQAFIHLDADRSGYITAQQLIALLYDHNVHPSWPALRTLVELLDTNGDGVIDYTEFGRAMHGPVGRPAAAAAAAAAVPGQRNAAVPASAAAAASSSSSPLSARAINKDDPAVVHRAFRKWCMQQFSSMRDAFRRINASRTGVVTEPELLAAVAGVVRGVEPPLVRGLFSQYDLNHDGLLQYNEFVKAMSFDTL